MKDKNLSDTEGIHYGLPLTLESDSPEEAKVKMRIVKGINIELHSWYQDNLVPLLQPPIVPATIKRKKEAS